MSRELPETIQPLLDELRAERFEQDIEDRELAPPFRRIQQGSRPTGYTLAEKYGLQDKLPFATAKKLGRLL